MMYICLAEIITMSKIKSFFHNTGVTGSVRGNSPTALMSRSSTTGHAVYGGTNGKNKNGRISGPRNVR